MGHEDDKNALTSEIASIASDMLNGKESFLIGSRKITALCYKADLRNDSDIIPFIVVESETDSLPIGEVRDLWAADALKRLEPELLKAETWARRTTRTHCANVVRRFGKNE